jgi:hypothetical protein
MTLAAIPFLRVSCPRCISGDASVPVAFEYGTTSRWHFGEVSDDEKADENAD